VANEKNFCTPPSKFHTSKSAVKQSGLVWRDFFDVKELWIRPIKCVCIWMHTHTHTHTHTHIYITLVTSYDWFHKIHALLHGSFHKSLLYSYTNLHVFIHRNTGSSLCHMVLYDPWSTVSSASDPTAQCNFSLSIIKKKSSFPNRAYLTQNIQTGDNVYPLKPTGHVMHHQFNIQQLYALSTLYLCVLYLSENKQRLVPLTAWIDWFL